MNMIGFLLTGAWRQLELVEEIYVINKQHFNGKASVRSLPTAQNYQGIPQDLRNSAD